MSLHMMNGVATNAAKNSMYFPMLNEYGEFAREGSSGNVGHATDVSNDGNAYVPANDGNGKSMPLMFKLNADMFNGNCRLCMNGSIDT
jgi:hypothetical protein